MKQMLEQIVLDFATLMWNLEVMARKPEYSKILYSRTKDFSDFSCSDSSPSAADLKKPTPDFAACDTCTQPKGW